MVLFRRLLRRLQLPLLPEQLRQLTELLHPLERLHLTELLHPLERLHLTELLHHSERPRLLSAVLALLPEPQGQHLRRHMRSRQQMPTRAALQTPHAYSSF
jgi:hypothetical protein